MRVVFYILFCIISFLVLFGLDYKRLQLWNMFLPPIIIVPICFITALIVKFVNGEVSSTFAQIGKSVIVAAFVLIAPMFFKIVFPMLLKRLTTFHQIHNAENLDKNPVKFFIKNQDRLVVGINVVAFIGSLVMFYGAFWG